MAAYLMGRLSGSSRDPDDPADRTPVMSASESASEDSIPEEGRLVTAKQMSRLIHGGFVVPEKRHPPRRSHRY